MQNTSVPHPSPLPSDGRGCLKSQTLSQTSSRSECFQIVPHPSPLPSDGRGGLKSQNLIANLVEAGHSSVPHPSPLPSDGRGCLRLGASHTTKAIRVHG